MIKHIQMKLPRGKLMTYTMKDLLKLKKCDHFAQDLTDEMLKKPLIGAIFWVDLNLRESMGSVQGGIRPCVIIDNLIEYDEIQLFTVIPPTTQLKALHLPTHTLIEPTLRNGSKRKSMALNEQLHTIDIARLKAPIGMIAYEDYMKLLKSIEKSLGYKDGFLVENQDYPANAYFELIDNLFVDVND